MFHWKQKQNEQNFKNDGATWRGYEHNNHHSEGFCWGPAPLVCLDSECLGLGTRIFCGPQELDPAPTT